MGRKRPVATDRNRPVVAVGLTNIFCGSGLARKAGTAVDGTGCGAGGCVSISTGDAARRNVSTVKSKNYGANICSALEIFFLTLT